MPDPVPIAKPAHKGWADLVVKICVVMILGYFLGHFVLPRFLAHQLKPHEPTDHEKWMARPRLEPKEIAAAQEASLTNPCFFLVPHTAQNQPAVSASVGDCLTLRPDGKRLDLFEFSLYPGGLLPIATDLYVPDVMSIAFTRTYVPVDDWSRKFRIFLPHVYDPYLTGNRYPYTYSDWLLPDRQTIHFDRISPGTNFNDYVGESKTSKNAFTSSRIGWNGWGWDLALADGTTFLSPEAYNAVRPQQGSLSAIFDAAGNETRLVRSPNGDLKEIISPSGKWIRLGYDSVGQLVSAQDSLSDECRYEYDSQGRLEAVNHRGDRTRYSYDSLNRLISVEDVSRSLSLKLKYFAEFITISFSGDVYTIQPTVDRVATSKTEGSLHIDITDRHGNRTRVRFLGNLGGDRRRWWVESASQNVATHR